MRGRKGRKSRRKPNLHHHRKAGNFTRCVEVAKWVFAHPISISDTCYTEITVYFDSAGSGGWEMRVKRRGAVRGRNGRESGLHHHRKTDGFG